jgi:hypothetical protein
MTEYEFHPLANLFPLMEGEEFDHLVEDIRENGLHEPIVLYEGKIIDGRNRYRACLVADVKPYTKSSGWADVDPLTYVISANLHRRHLTTQQRAAIAADLATMKLGDNKYRQEGTSSDAPSPSPVTEAQAAAALKVSKPSLQRAKRRKRTDPEAH